MKIHRLSALFAYVNRLWAAWQNQIAVQNLLRVLRKTNAASALNALVRPRNFATAALLIPLFMFALLTALLHGI